VITPARSNSEKALPLSQGFAEVRGEISTTKDAGGSWGVGATRSHLKVFRIRKNYMACNEGNLKYETTIKEQLKRWRPLGIILGVSAYLCFLFDRSNYAPYS
jgi:hypothetical protein